jgi:hypothetical protein
VKRWGNSALENPAPTTLALACAATAATAGSMRGLVERLEGLVDVPRDSLPQPAVPEVAALSWAVLRVPRLPVGRRRTGRVQLGHGSR